MYAVIESGGKQHRVIEGEVLNVELLEAAAGDKIDFNEVLMVGNGADVKIGAPFVAGGKVSAEVIREDIETWHTRKQAVVPVTVATHKPSALA